MQLRYGKRAYYIDLPGMLLSRRKSGLCLWFGLACIIFYFIHYQRVPHVDEMHHDQDYEMHKREAHDRFGRLAENGEDARMRQNLLAPIAPQNGHEQVEKPKKAEEWVRVADGSLPMPMDEKKRKSLKPMQQDILKKQIRPPDANYNINVTWSDHLSLDRGVPDPRPEPCKTVLYDYKKLGTATVVIPFYNEALSIIMRALHSILNRTPDILLKDIILVDDNSKNQNLKEPLEQYVNQLPKVTLLRNKEREGLIKARMRGCHAGKGDVVIFHDAHTEVNVGWLEPLLSELKRHPNAILQPFVDGIDAMTLAYDAPHSIHVGAFRWSLK